MNPLTIIEKYYTPGSKLYDILVDHSRLVTERALAIAKAHPELEADQDFIAEAAMLHDIGIFLTDAPDIECYGSRPYICHGTLGSELLKKEGLPLHALVCERHTGAGLSLNEIIGQNLPIPHRDMLPVSIEEQIICFSDKFYSKSDPLKEKSIDRIRKSMAKYGEASVQRFEAWCQVFLF
ncbi:HDIG domain-containing metalloprotein [Coprobacter tertius]|uniref:HDIG domain-containing protein n=1 Tax=Coprobacter tertius TaxID=2944915 RepID=A0ABT1ME35_9BACT|nr:HDIG domain-containing metalloprotein [Coprobacter tertius]MCP9610892.1 HDIG domain-containing protein [Coprobacter tertius]